MKKNLLKHLLLGFALCIAGKSTLLAQGYQCGTTQMHNKLLAQHPELAQVEADYNTLINQQIQAKSSSKMADSNHVYIIPIVFHILHLNGIENISDAQVIDQVNILNRDFRKLNADTSGIVPAFQGLAADTKIEFRLAQLDPDGNCTNGIDRIYSHKTLNANDGSKLNPWPRDKYLNVWVIKTMESVGTAGYAYYPSATATYMMPFDGIIIINNYIGSIGTASITNSRALTHEIGHWLNLPHCWGSTNDPEVSCGDDGVTDTPVTSGHNSCSNRFDYECDSKALSGTYSFLNVTTASGATDPTAPPMALDSGIIFSNPVATGVSANSSSSGMFDFSGWDVGALDGETSFAGLTGSLNNTKYYEFTVTPILAQALSLTGMTFNVQRDTNGIRTFAVRSNADGYLSNLTASITPANPNLSIQAGNIFFINNDTTISLTGSKITLSGALFTNINNTSRTFRIYGWNAEDVNGSFGVDNITLTGTHGIIENVENYMEYSYCSKMYTYGQKERMRSALENALSARNNLWISSNLAATGTNGSAVACVPEADFYANRYSVCPGGTVTFTKNIQNITAGLTTTATWSFPGGSPSTSTATSPTVTYNTPGSYDVTLTATNTAGTGTITKSLVIDVNDAYAQVPSTYSEGFENTTSFYNYWSINDMDGNARTWWLNSSAAYSGSRSIRMNAYFNYAYDVDQLFSPSYNLMYLTSPALTFRCAAATKATVASDMNDNLKVWVSKDCGATWFSIKTLTGTTLINNGYHPEEYVPSSPSQWALHSANIPASYVTGNTKFKFEYTSGLAGNSIYIDDINITGVLGVDDNSLENANVSIYPNPATQSATLSYHLNAKGDTKIEMVDVLGKTVMILNNPNQTEGDYSVEISKDKLKLTNGVYFIKFSINSTGITKKLIISE